MQHFKIEFVSDLWRLSPSTLVSPSNKFDHYDITEIILKVVLNTITTIQESKTGRIRNYIVLDLLCLNYKSRAKEVYRFSVVNMYEQVIITFQQGKQNHEVIIMFYKDRY